ncbi:MAG: transporter ATP-binding protein Uup [Pseudomonadota bacterium]|jgi:ATP-binding cassette subfamily F protein uup
MTPVYYIRNGSLSFGDKNLLSKTELYVSREDRICLIGRNGCGKSSLMKVISGAYNLDSGENYIEPGLKIGYLQQDIKNSYTGSVFSFVMEHFNNDTERYKAEMVLEQLDLDGNLEMNILSGGQFRRACLAKALIEEPDILLLDEPTNHLDIALIEWLENYIKSYPGAIICISHDRTFLGNITNKMWWLDRGVIRKADKGFKYFDEWQENILKAEEIELSKLNQKMDVEKLWLMQGVTARRKRNQGRLAQLKLLRERLRSKREGLASALRKMDPLALQEVKKTTFIIQMEHVDFGYGKDSLLKDFSFKVEKGEKIGVIGPNGSGKSTFIKLLTGDLTQNQGKIRRGNNLDISYFDQTRSDLNPEHSLKQILCPHGGDHVHFADGTSLHVASYMKKFMFDPRELDTKASTLSGGEAARLLLAKTLIAPGNLLVLDEPTNDLDMDSLEILIEILSDYKGTAIIVSHDRDFLERIVTRTLIFKGEGKIYDIVGGYDDWTKENAYKPSPKPANTKNKPKSEITPRVTTRMSYKDQRLLEILPDQIDALEKRNKEIEEILSDPDIFKKSPDKFTSLSNELAENTQKIEELTENWLKLV